MFNETKVIYEFRGPFGVPIQIGSSIVFLAFIFVSFNHGAAALFDSLIILALILGSIFLHELGHAWGMLVQGVPVRRIMIYGGGGFCEARRSTSPKQGELIVAMGPIVNITIWALASMLADKLPTGELGWILYNLAWINLFLAIFNMIPVLPLDGGRLFQFALLRIFPPRLAIRISGAVGLIIAVLWIPAMILCYVNLGFVLFFMPPIRHHWQMLQRRA